MVIHIQDTFIARAAMMGPFRFENVADDAVYFSFILWVIHEVALGKEHLTQKVGTLPGSLNIDLKRLHSSMTRLRW